MLTPEAYDVFTDGNTFTDTEVVLSEKEQLHNLAVMLLWSYTQNMSFDIVGKKMFGKVDACIQQKLDDIYNLLFYMDIIYDHRALDISNGTSRDDDYYVEEYCLDCLANRLACQDIPMDAIKRIYGLYHLAPGDYQYGPGGVSYQSLENDLSIT